MNEYWRQIGAFSRDARLLVIASVILALGTAAPAVFATLYFRAIGFDAVMIGQVTSANQIGGALGTIPAMLFLARFGRRASILTGASLSLLTWGLAIDTPRPELVLAWLGLSGAFNVLLGLAVVPLLAEASEVFERTTLFTVRDALVWLTLFLASVLTGYLPAWIAPLIGSGAESAESYRAVLLGSVLVRLFALIPLVMIRGRAAPAAAGNERMQPARESFLKYLDPRVLFKLSTPVFRVGLPFVLVYFGGSLVIPFLPLFLKDRHAASDQLIGATQGFSYLAIGVCTLLAPLLVQRFGRTRVIVAGALFAAGAIWLMGATPSRDAVVLLTIARAGIFNMVLPVYRALVIDAVPRSEHTIASLVLATAENIGATPAPRVSGELQRAAGYDLVFGLAGGLYLLGAAAFSWASKLQKMPEKGRV